MRSLSVGAKLWISTGILAAPLLGLGISYVQSLDARHGNAATHELLQDLVRKWNALKVASPASNEESLEAHDDLLDTAFALRGEIGADWKLALDPEFASSELIDVALMKVPDAVRHVGEARSRISDLFLHGEYSPEGGFRIGTLVALVGDRVVGTREELAAATKAATDQAALAAALNTIPKDWDFRNRHLAGTCLKN